MATVNIEGTCGTAAIVQSPLCVLQTDAKTPSDFGTETEKMAEWNKLRSSAGLHWRYVLKNLNVLKPLLD